MHYLYVYSPKARLLKLIFFRTAVQQLTIFQLTVRRAVPL